MRAAAGRSPWGARFPTRQDFFQRAGEDLSKKEKYRFFRRLPHVSGICRKFSNGCPAAALTA
jgi:hypothetical protein